MNHDDALAIVREIAAKNPFKHRYECYFCNRNGLLDHADTCLWRRAKALVESAKKVERQ